MEERFDKMFEYILLVEGGYSNHKNDKGGKTKYGIIEAVANKHNLNVETITKEDAKKIYYTNYYLKYKINEIRNFKIALSIFDFVVNAGTNGIKKAQSTLNILGYNLEVDGLIGNKTLNAINSVNFYDFLKEYHKEQREYYKKIVENNASQKVFLKGWNNRVLRKEEFLNNINTTI